MSARGRARVFGGPGRGHLIWRLDRGLLVEKGGLGDLRNLDIEGDGADAVWLLAAQQQALMDRGQVVGGEGQGVGGGDLCDVEIAGASASIGLGGVQDPGMHETDTSRRANMLDRLGFGRGRDRGGDGAGEAIVLPERVDRPPMRARYRHQWAVLWRYLVQEDQAGNHVVIGVRIEGEILVPADRGLGARELAVDFAVMQAKIRADQILQHGHEGGLPEQRQIGLGDLGRRLHPAERRGVRGVAGLHVKARATVQGLAEGAGMGPALLDPGAEIRVQAGDGRGVDDIPDGEAPGLDEGIDLILREGVRHNQFPNNRDETRVGGLA